MKEAMDNVKSRLMKLPAEFIFSCTNKFSEVLKVGEGGFDAVYKGKGDNEYFAVKPFLFDIAVEKNRVKEVSKGFLIELEVSSFVVLPIGFHFMTLCFSLFSCIVSGIEEVPTPSYCIFVRLSFLL